MSTALIPFNELQQMGSALAQSGLFGMKTPDQAIALMLVAQAEGQHPATIAQDYDIIQGKATRKTHSVLARFQAAGGKVEWHALTAEVADATFSHPQGGTLRMDWTFDQARKAGLVGKDNWKNYPRAMLRARLIAEGVRAVYPAAIGGMMIAEEAQDLSPGQINQAPEKTIDPGTGEITAKVLPPYPAEGFERNLPTWRALIETGKKTADQIIATFSTKGTPTEAQIQTLRAIKSNVIEMETA